MFCLGIHHPGVNVVCKSLFSNHQYPMPQDCISTKFNEKNLDSFGEKNTLVAWGTYRMMGFHNKNK